MKLDRTLIEKDGAPSEEEAREFFLKHDYTAHKSSFDPMKASEEDLRLYKKAKDFFKESWLAQFKSMGGKGSMKNFTKNYPLRVLEDANEDLISGTVIDAVSSKYRLHLVNLSVASARRTHSSEEISPERNLLDSTLASVERTRAASCSFDISNEKKITFLPVIETLRAILSAKLVLPIAGRAPIRRRSERLRPDVISSILEKPMGMPLYSSAFSDVIFTRLG